MLGGAIRDCWAVPANDLAEDRLAGPDASGLPAAPGRQGRSGGGQGAPPRGH